MIIQEAFWEKRNLGVTSCNFIIEDKDSVEILTDEILDNKEYKYQTVKLPVNKMEIHDRLYRSGFKFAEGKFELTYDLKHLTIPLEFEQLMLNTECVIAEDTQDQEFVFNEIRKGIFDTDKIALDPNFGTEIAANRYVNWSKDVLENGNGILIIVKVDGRPIGFVLQEIINNKVVYSMLGGLFDKHQNDGYGFFVVASGLLQTKSMGFKRVNTEVSTNNVNVLKLHLALGAKIKSMYYVLTKHI